MPNAPTINDKIPGGSTPADSLCGHCDDVIAKSTAPHSEKIEMTTKSRTTRPFGACGLRPRATRNQSASFLGRRPAAHNSRDHAAIQGKWPIPGRFAEPSVEIPARARLPDRNWGVLQKYLGCRLAAWELDLLRLRSAGRHRSIWKSGPAVRARRDVCCDAQCGLPDCDLPRHEFCLQSISRISAGSHPNMPICIDTTDCAEYCEVDCRNRDFIPQELVPC